MRYIYNLSLKELEADLVSMGGQKYRAAQIWQWLYEKRVATWDEMTNLPADIRTKLSERFQIESVVCKDAQGEKTRKLLVGLHDGEFVEEVLIPTRVRRTVCISSQVGCKYKCSFCASGQGGFRRNLEAGEMIGQVVLAAREYKDKPTNVVFMGVGEPFDNYDNVLKAVRIINDEKGLGIGARRITLSTAGIIPGIVKLAEENIQVELSVSLHAPDNDLRNQLMPINNTYPLDKLIPACRAYIGKTNRIITFEYSMIKGVNDSERHAEKVLRLLAALKCKVNLIPLSPVGEFDGEASDEAQVRRFMDVLEEGRMNVTLRASRGSSLDAACGQLRAAVASDHTRLSS
jgi:23S rRNA (adenine2503-C2)-methyltransferase